MPLASTEAIKRIREYRQESLFNPGPYWPTDIAEERLWKQLGCDTLLERIRSNPFAEPMSIVEEYVIQMDKFSDVNPSTRRMFTAMKEVGESVGCLLDNVGYFDQ